MQYFEVRAITEPVGWVERSETHHPSQHDNAAEAMGFASFYPSYALTRKFNSTLTVANIRRETFLSATRVDPLPASRPYRPPHDRFYILWS
jgi:hypothetical protein